MTVQDIIAERIEDAAPPADAKAGSPPPLLGFTALEDRVIALACRDGLATIEAPGLLERLASILFGLRLQRRALADARLEALRQAVVIARHRHHLPDAQALRLRGFGFTLRQIGTIEARAVGR